MVEILDVFTKNQDSVLVLLLVLFLIAVSWFINFSVWPFFTKIIEQGLTSFIEIKNREAEYQNQFTQNLLETIGLINTTLQALNNACIALDSKIDTLIERGQVKKSKLPRAE